MNKTFSRPLLLSIVILVAIKIILTFLVIVKEDFSKLKIPVNSNNTEILIEERNINSS